MYLMIPLLAIIMVISFMLGRKAQERIVSDLSPFSFADDMLIINTRAGFSVPNSSIAYIELQYNPKALQNRFYDMKIHLAKTDGSSKKISYRGSGSGALPQDMMAALTSHQIQCTIKH